MYQAMDYYNAHSSDAQRRCHWSYLGCLDYQEAWDIQRALLQARQDSRINDSLLLLEHPPTYTVGRRTEVSHLLLSRERLEELGAAVIDVDRGGQATYHGPGQLVGYPIVSLRGWSGPLHYVRTLESVLIGTLAHFEVQAVHIDGLTGVWVGDRKIAAIGVKISRGVTSHGFALNVTTDLSWFDHIISCGIPAREVTSLERVLGRSVSLEEVAGVVAGQFGLRMGCSMEVAGTEELLLLSGARSK